MKRTLLVALFVLGMAALVYAQKAPVKDSERGYIISPNDIVEVRVYEEPDLSLTLKVSQDGTIIYPLLGNIKASGLSGRQLEKILTDLLAKDYLVNPQVTVAVQNYANVSILGEVIKPGSYQMKEVLTLTQAIALAGGFTEVADTTKVKINRTADNKKETIVVNVDQILSKSAQDIELRGNDTIMAEAAGKIFVMGQVNRPGVYTCKKGMTTVEVIALAGGVTETAAANGTKVIRIVDGKKKVIVVPVGSILKGDTTKDIPLESGDTVVVPESFF